MTKMAITPEQKESLKQFLSSYGSVELLSAYLVFVEQKFQLHPVLFPKEKKVFQGIDALLQYLEREGKLWHETQIKITFSNQSVNELTKRIYICPFTGKVFGDNTHPNPQDAIYDWVSKCPENVERVGGLRSKRFFVSEDPEVIRGYLLQQKVKEPLVKTVYSSLLSGKLFNSKESLIKDFQKNYTKPLSLVEVQGQNKFEIEENFLTFLREQLEESKIAAFVETLAEDDSFLPYIEQWVESSQEDD